MGIDFGTVLFSKYKVLRILGKGGFSTVYLAENIRVGNLVAIKVVKKTGSDVDLMAEKNILKKLRHASIPVIIDIEEEAGMIYLIEEYVEGVTLTTLKRTLTEAEAIDIMLQLCDVLSYLHTSQKEPIIYRDMKPDNIIRMSSGHLKLVDFGIAKHLSCYDVSDNIQYGTRGYAAPEQYGAGKTDERTDIFSLGVCMFFLMTGKNLSTPPYKLNSLKQENYEVSSGFDKIITKCVETVPARRYQTTGLLIRDLKRLSQKEDPLKDYETFKQSGNRIVQCVGTKRGVGTTHLSLMIGAHYKRKNQKVAIIEYHKSDVLSAIQVMRDDVEETRHYFTVEGMDCYPFRYYGSFSKTSLRAYDVLVIDSGVSETVPLLKNDKTTTLVLSGLKEWEIGAFEEYYLNKKDFSSHYLFNFCDDETYKALKESVKGIKTYQMTYNPNPYSTCDATTGLLNQILEEQPIVTTQKGTTNHVKAFMDKAINTIQNVR